MSKRKITHQQQRRIDKKQALCQPDTLPQDADDATLQALGPEQSGLLIRRFGTQVEVEDDAGHCHPCHLRQHLPTPVCGDRVIWRTSHTEHGVVVAIQPRHTELVRLDRLGQCKPIAANVTQMLIVIAPIPIASFLQIDKFLIAAQQLHLTPLIVINKADLPGADMLYEATLANYRALNCEVILAIARQAAGLEALRAHLQHETNILVGQSGVGKSSLVQALVPEKTLSIGDLSEQTGLGTHTTTTAMLYHLPTGGDLIDSPGVRQFNLWPITHQELLAGFAEFEPYLTQCQFRNCQHDHETQCAIKDAVANGDIATQRYESYLTLLESTVS